MRVPRESVRTATRAATWRDAARRVHQVAADLERSGSSMSAAEALHMVAALFEEERRQVNEQRDESKRAWLAGRH